MLSKEETLAELNEIRNAMEDVWTGIQTLKFLTGDEYQMLDKLVGKLDMKISSMEEKIKK